MFCEKQRISLSFKFEQVSLLCLSSTSQQEVDIPRGDLLARSDIQDQFEGYKEYLASCQSQLEVNSSNI